MRRTTALKRPDLTPKIASFRSGECETQLKSSSGGWICFTISSVPAVEPSLTIIHFKADALFEQISSQALRMNWASFPRWA